MKTLPAPQRVHELKASAVVYSCTESEETVDFVMGARFGGRGLSA